MLKEGLVSIWELHMNLVPTLVYNSFLPQLAKKWQAFKVWSLKKVHENGAFYYINQCKSQGDAMPNLFPDSKSTIIGLSNEASFVSWYYCKISENWEKEESIIGPYVSKRGKLYMHYVTITLRIFLQPVMSTTMVFILWMVLPLNFSHSKF